MQKPTTQLEPATSPPPSGGELSDAHQGFAAIKTAFESALSSCPQQVRRHRCLFAGRTVCVRTVGQRLGRVVARALGHLSVPRASVSEPELSIDLWDGAQTNIPWQMMASWNGLGIDYWFAASPDQRYVVTERLRELTWFDRRARHIVGWISDARDFNLAERARVAYFPVLLWLHDLGLTVVHAGLVAKNNFGMLLAGETGHGKSTTSLTCLMNGFDFLSDDHVWIEAVDGGFLGHALYASVNLRPSQLDAFSSLAAQAIPGNAEVEDKFLVFLHPLFPQRIKSTTNIRALAVPRIVKSQKSSFAPAVKADVVLAMVQGSIFEWAFKRMPNPSARFRCITRMVNSLPCFYLDLGRDLSDIPRCVAELLDQAGRT